MNRAHALLVAVCVTACTPSNDSGPRVVVELAGSGLGFVDSTPRGLHCPGTCELVSNAGQQLTLEAGEGQRGSTFIGWSGACSGLSPCSLTVFGDQHVIAAFALLNETVVTRVGKGHGTVRSEPPGIDCGDDCVETFSPDAEVTLVAEPDGLSLFEGWSGACAGLEPCVISAAEAKLVTATFTPLSLPLTVSLAGDGAGTVTSQPTGLTCGPTCIANFPAGSRISLSASASQGSVFVGWEGACTGTGRCDVSLTSATTVTARFQRRTGVTLTVSTLGDGSGTITSQPTGIECGATCTAVYPSGTSVTLFALPSINALFTGWGGACQGTGPCVLALDAATTVTARFSRRATSLTVSPQTVTVRPLGVVNFIVAGGVPPYAFQLISGGGSIDFASGRYFAGPSAGTAVVRVQDSINDFVEASVRIQDVLELTPLMTEVSVSQSVTFSARGGTPPYRYSMVFGGGSIDAQGVYRAPSTTGQASVRVSDAASATADAVIAIINLAIVPLGAYPVTGATEVINGDWNGDGLQDLATAGFDGVLTFSAVGDAGFSAPELQLVGGRATALTSGDWNRDGRPDLAVTVAASSDVTLLQNAGADGGFIATYVAAGAATVGALRSGDYDRDGKPDVLVAVSNGLSVLRGAGNGTFLAPLRTTLGVTPVRLTQGDWNHDGVLDVAMTTTGTVVRVLLGTGTGTFALSGDLPISSGARDIASADVNRDGNLDLVVADLGASAVNAYLGDGNGNFGGGIATVGVGQNPQAIALGDWDGDGLIDLAVTDTLIGLESHLYLVPGFGNGQFSVRTNTLLNAGATSVIAADLDRDGRPEFAVTSGSSGLLTVLNNGWAGARTPRFNTVTRSLGASPGQLLTADWNLDGADDVLMTQASELRWSWGDGLGNFRPAQSSLSLAGPPMALTTGDWNRDGKPDVAQVQGPHVGVTLGPLFNGATTMDAGITPTGLVTADWNRDGKPDLAASNLMTADVSVLLGAGDGTFAAARSIDAGTNPIALTTADWNRDGTADLAVANQNGNDVSVLLGNGDGTFTSGPALIVAAIPLTVLSGDWNLDGKADLALTNLGSSELTLRLGRGDGSFSAATLVSLASQPGAVITGDWNGDGWTDFASIASATGEVRLLQHATSGGYVPTLLGVVSGGTALASGDWNRDGRMDLAVAQRNANTVTLFLSAP